MGNPGQGSNIRGKDPLDITQGSGPFWQDHGIDHMDDAIAGNDICLDDRRIIDPDTVSCVDSNTLALDGFSTAQLDHICSHDLARHDMVGQDRRQCFLVSQQCFQLFFRNLGECLVCRCKDCEGAVALQGFN